MTSTQETAIISDQDVDLGVPRLYAVILHNDDYTTMEFVVHILMTLFGHTQTMAEKIMLDIHTLGQGSCGIFTYDVALSKIKRTQDLAKAEQFPLRCSLEAQ